MQDTNPWQMYGFKKDIKKPTPVGVNPIKTFATEKMLKQLASERLLEDKGRFLYTNEVIWGHGSGSVRVRVTPNLGISIDRRTEDLNGNSFWTTKKLFKIKQDFAGREEIVSSELYDILQELVNEQIDSAKDKYKLLTLVNRVVEKVKQVEGHFVFQEIKKHDENWYTILFSLKGAGVGQLVRRTKAGETPAGVIELIFYPNTGNIHCILTTIGIEGESQAWEIMTPYFVSDFCPTQHVDEITKVISSALKYI